MAGLIAGEKHDHLRQVAYYELRLIHFQGKQLTFSFFFPSQQESVLEENLLHRRKFFPTTNDYLSLQQANRKSQKLSCFVNNTSLEAQPMLMPNK